MILYIVAKNLDEAIEGIRSGFGFKNLKRATQDYNNLKSINPELMIYEIKIIGRSI